MYSVIVTDTDQDEYEVLGEKLIAESMSRGAPDYLPNNKYFKVIDGKKLIGEAITTELRGSIELDLILVDKEYRGKGIGKLLLETIENYVRNIEADGIKVWTSSWEDAEFYNKMGFSQKLKIPLKTKGCFSGKEQFELLFYKSL